MTKVLVVDDSATVRFEVCQTLLAKGYTVVEAEDGHDAFTKLSADKQIDFIITDLNMPVMNGIEFLRKVKQTPELASKKLPIIMLTTEFAQSLKDQGRENDVKVWLVKPYKPELLLLAMNKMLSAQLTAKAA